MTRKYFYGLIALITSVILTAAVSFWLGGYIASNQTLVSAYRMQANLAFRHLRAYEQIHSYIISDCLPQAKTRLEFLINEQKMLMAEYVQSFQDKKYEDYVSLREPNLINELRDYHVDWDKEMVVPECD